jgi:TPP-dependent pyruvate/acetoin dehydrogenase alpha subunit
VTVSADQALDLYRVMATIRVFETTAGSLFAAGELPGFIHLSSGQEAVAAGVCSVLRRDDALTTTHRGHGHCIAKGGKVFGMLAELYGRAEGYGKGRSGSMHIADSSAGILGANAIVGGGLPMALGAAWSAQVRGEDRVAVAFFGDGAVAEGVFHETLNLAALWRLPLVLVCENNRVAEMTPSSVHLATTRVADFAGPYAIPGVTVDGNDVLVVRDAAATAVARARAGEGPTLLECETHRIRGHFEGDPLRYRSAEETAAWAARDPLVLFRARLAELGVPSARVEAVDTEVAAEVRDAAAAAAAAAPAPVSSLLDDVRPGVS